jgi:hypothetical protein
MVFPISRPKSAIHQISDPSNYSLRIESKKVFMEELDKGSGVGNLYIRNMGMFGEMSWLGQT